MKSRRRHLAGALAAAAVLASCVAAAPASAIPPFDPEVSTAITTSNANSPTGLDFNLTIPQDGLLDPDGIAPSDLKDAVIQLPTGLTIDPGVGGSLQACTSAQIGLHEGNAYNCPAASKIGTLTVETPLLDHVLNGKVFLATPFDNPFHSLFAQYLVVDDPQTGIVIKLPGRIDLTQPDGTITASFKDNPQLPFEHLHVELRTTGGGPLITPDCGSYAIVATLYPWARPNEAHVLNAPFTVSNNCSATRSADLTPFQALDRALFGKNAKAKKKKAKRRAAHRRHRR